MSDDKKDFKDLIGANLYVEPPKTDNIVTEEGDDIPEQVLEIKIVSVSDKGYVKYCLVNKMSSDQIVKKICELPVVIKHESRMPDVIEIISEGE